MTGPRPIGVFDSGIGGLSIVREMRRLMPHSALVYVSDARYLPYGDKTEEFLTARCIVIAEFLRSKNVRGIVVACNSATAAAIARLRARHAVPVIGIEPAVKPAAAVTRSGIVGIIATASTLQSRRYAELLERFGGFARVMDRPCPGLVECVEAGELDSPATLALLRRYIEPMLDAGADTLVLGCTHYPFLVPAIRGIVGPDVHIIDPSEAVARRALALLGDSDDGESRLSCFTSGDTRQQSRVMSQVLNATIEVSALPDCVVDQP